MSILSRLFGKGAAPEQPAEEHNGYRIIPVTMREGQVYRLAARIEKDVDGEVKVHQVIRADTLQSAEAAATAAIAKARQVIDEQGDRLFS